MTLLGLIGYPLTHSRSPELYADIFSKQQVSGVSYGLFPLAAISDLPGLLHAHPELAGFNVTIPHKQAIIPHLQHLSPDAAFTGAVNTVVISRHSEQPVLTGHNTDVAGFEYMLSLADIPEDTKALILGNGGAAKAVSVVLDRRSIPFHIVSRRFTPGVINYFELNEQVIEDHRLIINTTPLGMYPNVDSCVSLPWGAIGQQHYLLDLVYNPETTQFMKNGMLRGAFVMNGMTMLEKQAEKAWEIFKMHANL